MLYVWDVIAQMKAHGELVSDYTYWGQLRDSFFVRYPFPGVATSLERDEILRQLIAAARGRG